MINLNISILQHFFYTSLDLVYNLTTNRREKCRKFKKGTRKEGDKHENAAKAGKYEESPNSYIKKSCKQI